MVGLKVIMCNTRERPINDGWRAIVGYKGTRYRLHGGNDDSILDALNKGDSMVLPHSKGPDGGL